MIEQAAQNVRDALATAQCPAVLSSFGKDSVLLLNLVREVRSDFTVLWFRTGQSEHFARRIIREWRLTVYSWAPSDVYLLANNGDRTLVHEYSFGEHRLPVLIDLAAGNSCALTKFTDRTPQLFLPFDVILTGYKDCDEHWVKGNSPLFQEGTTVGHARMFAPLRHLSDEQVRAAIFDRKIPFEPTPDELPLCTSCMTAGPGQVFCPEVDHMIPAMQWEKDKSLTAFKQRFGLEVANA